MNKSNHPEPSFPTVAQVLEWQRKLDAITAEEAEMKARHAAEERAIRDRRAKLNKLVAAATDYLDVIGESKPELEKPKAARQKEPAKTAASRQRSPRAKGKTWQATILKVSKRAFRGMTYADLKEALGDTHLADTLKRTDKALYGGTQKLVQKGKLIQHHGRFYTPEAYRQFMADVAAGKVEDVPAPHYAERASPNEEAITILLSRRPDGIPPKELLDTLLSSPPPGLNVSKNRGSLFNALARMKKKGEVDKRGGRYYLPRSKGEAPGSSEPSASHSTGDEGGTSSSSGARGNGAFAGASSLAATYPGANPAPPRM